LEEVGIVEPVVADVPAETPLDCGKALAAGQADVIAVELQTASDMFTKLGVLDKVAVTPSLVPTYHVIMSKSNPKGRNVIAMLNRGLAEMRESVEWYGIVATGVAEYNGLNSYSPSPEPLSKRRANEIGLRQGKVLNCVACAAA
jgi:ABC-type amino acid transport substrate-binding protein